MRNRSGRSGRDCVIRPDSEKQGTVGSCFMEPVRLVDNRCMVPNQEMDVMVVRLSLFMELTTVASGNKGEMGNGMAGPADPPGGEPFRGMAMSRGQKKGDEKITEKKR